MVFKSLPFSSWGWFIWFYYQILWRPVWKSSLTTTSASVKPFQGHARLLHTGTEEIYAISFSFVSFALCIPIHLITEQQKTCFLRRNKSNESWLYWCFFSPLVHKGSMKKRLFFHTKILNIVLMITGKASEIIVQDPQQNWCVQIVAFSTWMRAAFLSFSIVFWTRYQLTSYPLGLFEAWVSF